MLASSWMGDVYRNCIFCSAALGANESIEHFPVGRALAFDGTKGRLWAICPKCARWNLAPIEERWEAIEEAEKRFRDTPLRAQSENVGLANLAGGTRLIRIGAAPRVEVATWRYAAQMEQRGRRALWYGAAAAGAGVAVAVAGLTLASAGVIGALNLYWYSQALIRRSSRYLPAGIVTTDLTGVTTRVRLRRADIQGAWITAPDDGRGIALNLPCAVEVPDPRRQFPRKLPLVLRGDEAKGIMARTMVHVNGNGASRGRVESALETLDQAGGPEEYLREVGRRRLLLNGGDPRTAEAKLDDPFEIIQGADDPRPDPETSLTLEMALHQEAEQRAMEGELAALTEMWRQAEEIAAIADRLPDALDEEAR